MAMRCDSGALRLLSKHNRDIVFFMLVWLGLLAGGLTALWYELILRPPQFDTAQEPDWEIFLPTVGILLTVTARVIQSLAARAFTRLGVVHLFRSEISSLCRAIGSLHIADSLTGFSPDSYSDFTSQSWSRRENYSQVFANNTSGLADLPTQTVLDVTAFYTFFKTSRDAAQIMDGWSPNTTEQKMQDDVCRVMIQLRMCFEAARNALLELADEPDEVRTDLALIDQVTEKLSSSLERHGASG